MLSILRSTAESIMRSSIQAVLPDAAVARALKDLPSVSGRTILVACGKAAWQMARAATEAIPSIQEGVVITKYDHVMGAIPGITCNEAGHPVPDTNGFSATDEALRMTADLTERDLVLFLISGGGSALFESPLIPGDELQDITKQLLACGADITEINTIRKRLSAVKGGRFALHCAPAHVYSIVLSDIIGDPLDMIASGPAYPDTSTSEDALSIIDRYSIRLSDYARSLLLKETPKHLSNVTTNITGSVRELCAAAATAARSYGYTPLVLTDRLDCEARLAGTELGALAYAIASGTPLPPCSVFSQCDLPSIQTNDKIALIAGGETIVHLTGHGLGGRNQELALAAARSIRGLPSTCVFSFGSDGTDGPTDAAGGYVDGDSFDALSKHGLDPDAVLKDNDAYHALQAIDGLLMTGPTGTNVNDVSVALIGS